MRSGDIRRQSLKSSEIAPKFECFWPLFFLGGKDHTRDWRSSRQRLMNAKMTAFRNSGPNFQNSV